MKRSTSIVIVVSAAALVLGGGVLLAYWANRRATTPAIVFAQTSAGGALKCEIAESRGADGAFVVTISAYRRNKGGTWDLIECHERIFKHPPGMLVDGKRAYEAKLGIDNVTRIGYVHAKLRVPDGWLDLFDIRVWPGKRGERIETNPAGTMPAGWGALTVRSAITG